MHEFIVPFGNMEKGLIFLEIQIRWSLYFIKVNHINPTPFLSVAKCYKTMKWKKKIHSFIRVHIHNPPRACMTKGRIC